MEDSLLAQNDLKRLHIPTPLLLAFSTGNAVYMGILFYAGQTLSLNGRTPLPETWAISQYMAAPYMVMLIAAAFIISISFAYFFPQHTVRFLRYFSVIELCSALALTLPLPDYILSKVFLFYCFIFLAPMAPCTALITYIFKGESAKRYVTLGYGLGFFTAAIMQNDMFPVPFSAFRFFMIFSAATMCFFFHKMPADVWPRLAGKGSGLIFPRRLFILVYALFNIGGLASLFGSAIAETVPHGPSVFYGALAAGLGLVYVIWKCFDIPVLRIGSVSVGIGVLGYILALLSLYFPALAIPACIVLSAGSIVCWLTPLFTVTLAKLYPARSLVPLMVLLGLVTMLFHMLLLEAFRDNTYFLYIAYLVIAVGMGVLYLLLEPYLSFTLRVKTPFDLRASLPETKTPGAAGANTEPRQGGQSLEEVLQAQAFDKLTRQELRIVELILRGYSYTEIGRALIIKPNTVKSYQKSIYSKLQINSKRELFAMAEKKGKEMGAS